MIPGFSIIPPTRDREKGKGPQPRGSLVGRPGGVRRFGEKVQFVFQGREWQAPQPALIGDTHRRHSRCGEKANTLYQLAVYQKHLEIPPLASRGHEGVASGVGRVLGSVWMLKAPCNFIPQKQPGLSASEVCEDQREPIGAGPAQQPLRQCARAGAPLQLTPAARAGC